MSKNWINSTCITMATHYLDILNPAECPCFDLIKNGTKTVEGRKNSPKYQLYAKGDILILNCGDKTIQTRIKYINCYSTIRCYLETETLERALPGIATIDDGITFYNSFTTEQEREMLRKKFGFGFLGIGIELI